MNLRRYQAEAIRAIQGGFMDHQSALLVMATGLGKTVTFGHVIKSMHEADRGRSLVLAHREELIHQAARTIERITGTAPDIEMAAQWADQGWQAWRSPTVVSTIQTQISGRKGLGRMTRFKPADFGLVVVDEAHRAAAHSYRKVIEYYRSHKPLRLLGVTATPNRHDEKALGQIFEHCAYQYGVEDGIRDGWLVPVQQASVQIEGLDLSRVKTTAGDLDAAQLERELMLEKPLLGLADATIRETGDMKSLVFAAGVSHAERLCEILNRYKPDCARSVNGKTPKDARREIIGDFAERRFQYLVNVGVLTEGFDDPGIECIVMGRPTKSLPLYQQMLGRGMRPLPGVVDGLDDEHPIIPVGGRPSDPCELRRSSIAGSPKPFMLVLDFTANSDRHKLVSAIDALGGKYDDEVLDLARQWSDTGKARGDLQSTLEAAQQAVAERHAKAEERKRAEAERRKHIKATATYSIRKGDPFQILGLHRNREPEFAKGAPPSEKQIAFLQKQGIDTNGLTRTQATQLIGAVMVRWDKGLVSFKQDRLLQQYGFPAGLSRETGGNIIGKLVQNRFKMTPDLHHLRLSLSQPKPTEAANMAAGAEGYTPPPPEEGGYDDTPF